MSAPSSAAPDERASARPARGARTPWPVWLAVLGTVLAGGVGTAVADSPPADRLGTPVERFLPEDGTAYILEYEDGASYLVESAFDTGVRFLLQSPGLAGDEAIGEIESRGASASSARLWRQTATDLDGVLPQIVLLFAVTPQGVVQLSSTGGAQSFSFRPGLLFLPPDPVDGDHWGQEGAALPLDILGYTTSTRLAAAENGCLRSESTLDYTDPASGSALLTTSGRELICPGLGAVESSGESDGEPSSSRRMPFPGRGLAGVLDAPAHSWPAAEAWTAGQVALRVSDATFGDWDSLGVPEAAASVTASGVVVLSYGIDAMGFIVEGRTATRSWIAHPGGTIIQHAAIGDAVLLSTTRREVVAYDHRGRRAWTASFPDAVRALPVGDGQGGVVLASLDGTVARIDLATGAESWRVSPAGEIDAPLAVDGDAVYLADRENAVLSLELATGETRWRSDLLMEAATLTPAGGQLVAGVENGTVQSLDAATGRVRWSVNVEGIPSAAELLDGETIVVQTGEGMSGHALDGTRLFSVPGIGLDLVGDGRSALGLADDGTAVLVDASGAELGRWSLPLAPFGVSYALALHPDGAWIIGTDNSVFEVGLP